jgi:hypothetical protein
MNQYLKSYLENGFPNIIGFQEVPTFLFLDHLDASFPTKKGGALEIGVHHGQFFIALNSLTQENFKSYAIDVFDNKDLNVDQSGDGDLSIFLENLDRYDKHQGKNTVIIKGDSTDRSIFENVEKCHFISVDGGHTPEHVVNDLTVCSDIVTDNGVVIVDDYFNHWWPSVTEGIVKYLITTPTLVPFATSKNKMWMCKLSWKKKYLDIARSAPSFQKTNCRFFGHDLVDLWN